MLLRRLILFCAGADETVLSIMLFVSDTCNYGVSPRELPCLVTGIHFTYCMCPLFCLSHLLATVAVIFSQILFVNFCVSAGHF